jgi:hypothetical protein
VTDRWRAVLALAIPASIVGLLRLVPPPELGSWLSAVVIGGGSSGVALVLMRGSRAARAAVAVACSLAGALVGLFLSLGLHIGPTSHNLSQVVSAIGVPAGFEKSGDYSCDIGPFCPETVYTRDYLGNGLVAAVADSILARMRKACFKDAAISSGGTSFPDALVLTGTCASRDARVGVSVYEERIGPGPPQVRVAFGASGL